MQIQGQPDLSPKFQVNQCYIVKILFQKNKERKRCVCVWGGGYPPLCVDLGGAHFTNHFQMKGLHRITRTARLYFVVANQNEN